MERKPHHSIFCAILTLSSTLLKTGLETLLLKRVNSNRSRILFEILRYFVWKHGPEMITYIDGLLNEHKINYPDRSIPQYYLNNAKINVRKENLIHSIAKTEYSAKCGRSFVLQTDNTKEIVSRGTSLLRELPFICCTKTGCACLEDSLLPNHLLLAWSLFSDASIHDPINYQQFLNDFFSGLTSTDSFENYSNESVSTWSDHMICLMTLCSSLMIIHQNHPTNRQSPHHSQSLLPFHDPSTSRTNSPIDRNKYNQQVFDLFQCLCRIPCNTHAIHEVRHSTESFDQVISKRLGYAIYPTASSINHSCLPNASIRYDIPEGAVDLLDQLANTAIEITSLQGISSHPMRGNRTEITVSYGPLHGIHSYSARQLQLQQQYLFQCKCDGCRQDVIRSSASLHPSNPLHASPLSTSSPSQLDIIHSKLTHLHSTMQQLNKDWTNVLHQCRTNPQPKALDHFQTQRLHPVQRTFDQLISKLLLPPSPPHPTAIHRILTSQKLHPIDSISHQPIIDHALFIQFCSMLCGFLDIFGHFQAIRTDYPSAIAKVELAIFYMKASGMYRCDDVVIGRELIKLAPLYVSSSEALSSQTQWIQSMERCQQVVMTAMYNLQPSVTHDDPDWIEANRLLHYVQHELLTSKQHPIG